MMKDDLTELHNLLDQIELEDLLHALDRRGGTFSAVAKAQLLVLKKSEDYNGAASPGAARDEYFPFGVISYAQMLHTKAKRFVEVARKEEANFESLEDTALDIINYASFFLDWSERAHAIEQGGHPMSLPSGSPGCAYCNGPAVYSEKRHYLICLRESCRFFMEAVPLAK